MASEAGSAIAASAPLDGLARLTSAITATSSFMSVTVDNAGNVFVSKNSGETWKKEYTLSDKLTSVSCASTTLCATVDTTGNVTAFKDRKSTRLNSSHL